MTTAYTEPQRNVTRPKKKVAHFASFEQARRYVEGTGQKWTMELNGCIYCVCHFGRIIGKGLNWNVAIADAESNLGSLIHDFPLDLQ